MNRPKQYHGPTNLGQLWEMSEDAQEIWKAYEELSNYVDSLETSLNTEYELLGENEQWLRDAFGEVADIVNDIDHMRVGEIRSRLKDIVYGTMAEY